MRTRFISLIAACLLPVVAWGDTLELIGMHEWESELVIGVSGIEVTPDGMKFVTVTDRGWWFKGDFLRDGEVITGIDNHSITAILGNKGDPVAARRIGDWSDAEGLAISEDGRAWVSFERWARVSRYDGTSGRGAFIKDHESFIDFPDNWELEAVAIDPKGQVYTFSEKPLHEGFPIFRLSPSGWVIDGYLPERDVFSIVGADFADNGDLYLLERKLVLGLWWQNRVRRVRLIGDFVLEDETLWTGERDEFLNLEGISVWRDDKGLRLTIVSDNNGNQDPTQFVEFRLTE